MTRSIRWAAAGSLFFAVARFGTACDSSDSAHSNQSAGKVGQGGTHASGAGGAPSGMGGTAGHPASTGGAPSAAGKATSGGRAGGQAGHAGAGSSLGGTNGGGMGDTENSGGGADNGHGEAGGGGTPSDLERCDAAALVWKSANKTNYTSYPDPNSEECIKYNGCMWAGQFAACDGKKAESWVAAHNIVAAFPDFDALALHDLCLRAGNSRIVVTVLDTCGDSDCDGCCTQNQGSADELIDIESYTNDRWGKGDGPIEWADLGPTTTSGCD